MIAPAQELRAASTFDRGLVEVALEPPPAKSRARVAVALMLVGVCGVFAARCWPAARYDSITSDETTHLIRMLHLFQTGDDLGMWELGAPRLPHVLGASASYVALSKAGMLPGSSDQRSIAELVLAGWPRVLLPARCVAIAWGMSLLVLVFWAVARCRGATSGLIAAAIVSMVPECIAHSSIAGSDMPFTASAFLTLILLTRYVEKPSRGRWTAVAMGVGFAWAMRHSALLLLPLAATTHLVVALRRPRPPGLAPLAEVALGSTLATASMIVMAFVVLWAGDGFGTVPVGEMPGRSRLASLPDHVGPIDVDRLPIPSSALSVLKQMRHQNQGHEAYLCGSISQTGWISYFPVAFLLKTPVGLLALMVLAIARFMLKKPTAFEAMLLACMGLLWFMLLRSRVNIGVRYAILTYPLMAPYMARLFDPRMLRDRIWGPLTIAAAAWFAWASVGAHSRYLSSFNEIAGGPSQGWLYLADSNLDWGQDLDALGPVLKSRGIREVTTDISSQRRLNSSGVYAIMNPSREFQVPANVPANRRIYDSEGGYIPVFTRHVAVSASRLLGLYSQNDMSWLRTRKLVDRVGDSIFVFDMETPADRPL